MEQKLKFSTVVSSSYLETRSIFVYDFDKRDRSAFFVIEKREKEERKEGKEEEGNG